MLSQLTLESFPGGVDCDDADFERLTGIAETCQLVIAIERFVIVVVDVVVVVVVECVMYVCLFTYLFICLIVYLFV